MNKEKRIRKLASDMDYGCTKRDLYPDDAKEIAKALDILGYRKIVWHKVKDGDLPKPNTDILFLSVLPNGSQFYDLGVYSCVVNLWYGNICTTTTDKIIAWTELPIYEE